MRPPPHGQSEVEKDFAPIARRIVLAAIRVTTEKLNAANASLYASLTPLEQRRLRKPVFRRKDIVKLETNLVNDFFTKKMGYEGLLRKAQREVAELTLSQSISSYCRSGSVEPMVYYLAKYREFFALLELPWRSLLFVDSNLYASMPPAGVRCRLVGSRRSIRRRQLLRSENEI
jgi:hypothetical protein